MKERPTLCENCPIFDGVHTEVTEVYTDPRKRRRSEDYIYKIIPKLRKVFILNATLTIPSSSDEDTKVKVRVPIRAGLRRRESIKLSIRRCRGPKRGVETDIYCPAISVILPRKGQS